MRQGRHAVGIVPGHANHWRVPIGAGVLHAVLACEGGHDMPEVTRQLLVELVPEELRPR